MLLLDISTKNNPLLIKNLLQNGSLLSAPTCLLFLLLFPNYFFPKTKNIDVSKMTETQFNNEMENAYQEMLDNKGVSVQTAFSSIKRAE